MLSSKCVPNGTRIYLRLSCPHGQDFIEVILLSIAFLRVDGVVVFRAVEHVLLITGTHPLLLHLPDPLPLELSRVVHEVLAPILSCRGDAQELNIRVHIVFQIKLSINGNIVCVFSGWLHYYLV